MKFFKKKKKEPTINLNKLRKMILDIREKNVENVENAERYQDDPAKDILCLECFNHVKDEIITMHDYILSKIKQSKS
jgi:hypothetical protein